MHFVSVWRKVIVPFRFSHMWWVLVPAWIMTRTKSAVSQTHLPTFATELPERLRSFADKIELVLQRPPTPRRTWHWAWATQSFIYVTTFRHCCQKIYKKKQRYSNLSHFCVKKYIWKSITVFSSLGKYPEMHLQCPLLHSELVIRWWHCTSLSHVLPRSTRTN